MARDTWERVAVVVVGAFVLLMVVFSAWFHGYGTGVNDERTAWLAGLRKAQDGDANDN